MLYYNFNYKEFTYRFGMTEHDNGKKSRRNKVLLNFIKDRKLLKECIKKDDFTLLNISNMVEFKKTMFNKIQFSGEFDMNLPYKVELINYTFHSNKYSTDEMRGLCEDSDYKSCRYFNHKNNGRIFKMKAGKLSTCKKPSPRTGRPTPCQPFPRTTSTLTTTSQTSTVQANARATSILA